MINTVTIVGNLGQDPEIRYTASGVPVASFTVVNDPNPRISIFSPLRSASPMESKITCTAKAMSFCK